MRNNRCSQFTVNLVELAALPPFVVILIGRVFAAVGTVAVIWISEFTVKLVAFTLPNVTADLDRRSNRSTWRAKSFGSTERL